MNQENNQLQFFTLAVQSVEIKDNRVVVKANGKSYSFFQTKQSGEPSRAQTDYLKLGVRAGQTYSFGIAEKQSVNSKTGQPITFRNIGCISEAQEPAQQFYVAPTNTTANVQQSTQPARPYVPTPAPTTTTNTPQDPAPQSQPNELQALSDRLTALENRVSLLDSEAKIDTAEIPPLEKGNEELDEIKTEEIPL